MKKSLMEARPGGLDVATSLLQSHLTLTRAQTQFGGCFMGAWLLLSRRLEIFASKSLHFPSLISNLTMGIDRL